MFQGIVPHRQHHIMPLAGMAISPESVTAVSPLKNGLKRYRDVVPNFAGSKRAKKIESLAEASLANR